MLFATPDFGAGGCVFGLLLLVAAAFVAIAWASFHYGIALCKTGLPKRRFCGACLIVFSVSAPFFCCFGPPFVVRIVYGNFPLGTYPNRRIREGMTANEVETILGTPHQRYQSAEGDSWYYWIDSFGLGYFGVRFGPDGRVTSTHGN